jgi:hypothetical protein
LTKRSHGSKERIHRHREDKYKQEIDEELRGCSLEICHEVDYQFEERDLDEDYWDIY